MFNFAYNTPTKVEFGKGKISVLEPTIANFGKKVLLVYGGGSIKKMGLYDKVYDLLKGYEIFEVAKVEPNPKIASVRQGVEICKKEKIDVVLAVGGGSVLDCAKAICAGTFYEGDAWDLVLDSSKVHKALPLVTVLTLSATGSEYDWGAVISNPDTNEKLPLITPYIFPYLSILDPEYTFSVPKNQTAAGTVDMMSHIFEQYFVVKGNDVTDGLCETILKTAIKNCRLCLKDPNDYDARANLMWASSLACNGICAVGREGSPWVCHGIEHEISAYYDITHGVGLAILTPRWMEYSLNDKTLPRYCQYARNVWALTGEDSFDLAKKAIALTFDFFKEIGIPMTLSELNIDDKHIKDMAKHACEFNDFATALRPLDVNDVENILRMCL